MREELRRPRRRGVVLWLFGLFFVLFLLGGLYCGYIFLYTGAAVLRAALVVDWAPPQVSLLGAPGSGPPSQATSSVSPAWPKDSSAPPGPRERVTILVLGLDQRPDEKGGPSRTDTMILVTLDPATNSAGLLSIPRDLWVAIPGYADNKINTAHFLGEKDKLPGGGVTLAKKTVEYNFGLPVHYYIRADFNGFVKVIDILGGIDIDVSKGIIDYEYPTDDYEAMTVRFSVGRQHMDGARALQYARTRHSDSDFARMKRQQQVLLAVREQALRLDLLPKLPALLGTLLASVDTDIPVTAMPALAKAASEVSSDNIAHLTIDADMVTDLYGDGSILIPKRDTIRKLIVSFTAAPGIREEEATIEVQNGTTRNRLAATVAEYLEINGLPVAKVSQASSPNYPETLILDHSGTKRTTVAALAGLLRVPARNIRNDNTAHDHDITVVLGMDVNVP